MMFRALLKGIDKLGVDAVYTTTNEEGKKEVYNIRCSFTKATTQEAEIINNFGSYSKIVTIPYNSDFEPMRFDTLVVNGVKHVVVSSVRLTAPDGIIGYKCYCNGVM